MPADETIIEKSENQKTVTCSENIDKINILSSTPY